MTAFVQLTEVHLHFGESHDLKGKRKELSSLKAQLRQRLHCAVAETAHQDLWQRAELTVALTAGSAAGVETAADGVERWLEERLPQGVAVERHVRSVGDLRGGA